MPTTPVLQAAEAADAPHRILPVFAGDDPLAALPEAVRASARQTAALRRFTGEAGRTLLLPFGGEQWLAVGLGPAAALSGPAFCEALAKAYAELKGAGAGAMALLLPEGLPWPDDAAARLAGEAIAMAGYAFRAYRSKVPPEDAAETTVTLVAPRRQAAVAQGLRAAAHVGAGIALTRDLVNHPAAVAHPDFVAEQAHQLARDHGARFTRIRGDELAEQGYGAIHAVGRAAEHPPQLVALEYGAPAAHRPTVALVGKGVTFDSGGLDLKTSSGMALMKKDMGGAATVLGAFRAAAGLELPVHLVAVLALAENAVDARSYHPGDVLRTRHGLTVEITNTDAEGRLVLADALALARGYGPHYMVDFATLTGACRTALGKQLMGLFCDHAPLREAIVAAGERTGDAVWPLPLWAPYRKELDSAVADLANASSSGMAGAITAALFLKEFAGDIAWAHLDCYAWSDGDSPLLPKGGSGLGVRLCADLLTRLPETGADGR